MNGAGIQSTLLPAALPTAALYLLAMLGAGVWAALHRLQRPPGRWPLGLHFAGRVAIGWLALVVMAEALQRTVLLATSWPLWLILLGGALATETVFELYRLERHAVPRRVGMLLSVLRGLLVLCAAGLLCQPVLQFERARRVEREVAVLVDRSASMGIADTGLLPTESLRLAERLGVAAAARAHRLERILPPLRQAQQELAAQADWLAALAAGDPTNRLQQVRQRGRTLRDTLAGARRTVAAQAALLAAPLADARIKLGDPVRAQLADAGAKLQQDILGRLDETLQALTRLANGEPGGPADSGDRLLDNLRGTAAALLEFEPKLAQAGEAVDQAFYDGLSATARAAIQAEASRSRYDLACRLLLQRPPPGQPAGADPAFLDRLASRYGVRLYTFASQPAEAQASTLAEAPPGAPPTNAADAGPVQGTDLAAALEKAAADIPADKLAGVLLLSDGRHNGPRLVEPVARKLGLRPSPICPVVFGGGRVPPRDAAIAAVTVPDTVFSGDKVALDVEVKLDGLAGTNVTVELFDGASNVATRTLTAVSASDRPHLQLTDEPKTSGLHAYRVALQPPAGDLIPANNAQEVPVTVTDDRIKVLLIDDRPRWEFRYLKNLFTGRDASVQLQYVLFHADEIAKSPPRPAAAAAVTRAGDEAEATALPTNETEWLKFDVVLLGDVAPAELGAAAQRDLERFVGDRGGALVVISGPQFMPHAYGGSAFAELLPVTFASSDRPVLAGPEASYRIALTPEGRASVLMQLAGEGPANDAAWAAVPDCTWRHALLGAKAGAAVLAYAIPDIPPPWMQARGPSEVPDEALQLQRQQFVRENTLAAIQQVGLGRVLCLAFDQTWRLRYRIGDRDHHRFWGQVLRWAAPDKLPCGTAFVRLGTDRSRYAPDTPIRVRARLLRRDFTPLPGARPVVDVWAGTRHVLRERLQYVPDSAGFYAAELGALPPGRYRVDLDPAAAEEGLAPDGAKTVSAEFAVTPMVPAELVELAADRGLLTRLATLTGGRVVEPWQADDLVAAFGPPSVTVRERRQLELWNSWALLAAMLLLASAEWLLRKRASLP